jgi:hypothetical protein
MCPENRMQLASSFRSAPLAEIFQIKGCRPAQFRKFLEFKFVTCFVLETMVILRWYSITLLNKEIKENFTLLLYKKI